MPTLFISYKRGTAAVAPLMERLQNAHYRLWFDRDEIHLGDPNWQARIDQGLQRCDGVILNITPAACQSEPVRYEVKKARELEKPIFPVVLERIADYDAAIRDLGLADKQHIEDFTDVTRWDAQIERLLRDLELQGLRVTRHDRRQQRDRSNPTYVLHQTYLKRLVERIGTLNLAQVNPDNAQGIELERVYVDSPTGLSLSAEVQNWQVIDWWISESKQQERGLFGFDDNKKPDEPRRKPHELGYETAPFETLIGWVDNAIARYRQENPGVRPDKKYSWLNEWNNGVKRNLINLHLNHLAAARDRLVILGAPGSGKSTFVKFLALCLAGSGMDDWTRQASIAALDNWPHGALTPIYIELRRLVVSKHFPADVKTPATADHLWAYIEHEVLGEALAAYAEDLRYDLEQGHAVLILDGLDEVPYPEGKLKQRQQQLISLAQSLNTRYATSRIIVASRPYAYEGWTLPGFQAVTITEFEDDHRTALASRLYRTAGLDEDAASEKAQALNQQLMQIDDELKDRPLFVTLMATIYLRGDSEGLPTRRGALYRESILLLLDRWTQSKPGAPSLIEILGDKSLDDLYARLAALAYEVHEQYGEQPGTPEIDESLLYKHLKPLGRSIAAELIPYLSENAGVLVCPGRDDEKDVFHFAHRTFQEYLAAAHLMTLCAEADSFGLVRERLISKPQVWRVPCVLAGDVLADTDRRGDLWDLLDDLLDDEALTLNPSPSGKGTLNPLRPEGEGPGMRADDPRWWTVWLASVILQEQKLLESDKLRRSEKAVADQLRGWLLALLPTPQALPPVERALCGRALSLLDDPRPGVGVMPSPLAPLPQGEGKRGRGLRGEGWLPLIEWCDIPAPPNGSFIMGADDQSDNPRREVELKHSFKMAKYLITYQQFQTFVDSGEYDQPDWWIGFPPKYQPQAMAEQYNPYDKHPRDSVSWYQAVAFCRWLTVKYREAGLLPGQPSSPALLPQGEGSQKLREMAARAMVSIARDLRERQTNAEALLWECLRDRRLADLKFRRQHPVAKTNYVVDFFCYEHHLVVELDGGIHLQQVEADRKRQQELEALGLQVIRFTNDQVFNQLEAILTTLLHVVESPFSLREKGTGDEGWIIRLPTEQEWEYAARGTDERTYPYPGDFDATKVNTSETGIGQTSAVGLFPDGASPFGVLDMSGNLFEWCLNDYNKPEIIDGCGNEERKVLRGGSFLDDQYGAAASSRHYGYPHNGDYNLGVRLVVAAPIASLNSGNYSAIEVKAKWPSPSIPLPGERDLKTHTLPNSPLRPGEKGQGDEGKRTFQMASEGVWVRVDTALRESPSVSPPP